MRVLITGGAGFIGSHLVRKLLHRGDEVFVLDDLSSGDLKNLAGLKVDVTVGSVTDLSLVLNLMSKTDTVFHLATQCLVIGIDNPNLLHKTNDLGTFNICLGAKEHNNKIVYIGTSEEYGPQESFPIKEDASMNPISLYALTKVIGEQYIKFFHETYKVPSVIIRPFNTFGPLQREDLDENRLMKGFNAYAGVITAFIKRLEKNEPPVIFGNGLQSRDFTYVTDIVDGILMLSQLEDCEIVNLGSGADISVFELAHLLIKIWKPNSDLQPIFGIPRMGDLTRLLADISKAKSYGYQPKVKFEEGLRAYVKWWRSVSHG